jgi:tetratricopeptide (TPR) repeat protein
MTSPPPIELDVSLISGDAAQLQALLVLPSLSVAQAVFSGDIPHILASASEHPLALLLCEALVSQGITAPPRPAIMSSPHIRYTAAVALLNAFLRANFTGPPLPVSPHLVSSPDAPILLALDGEDAPPSVIYPHLLLVAQTIFLDMTGHFVAAGLHLAPWWTARACMAHHSAMDRPTPTLFARIFSSFISLLGSAPSESSAPETIAKLDPSSSPVSATPFDGGEYGTAEQFWSSCEAQLSRGLRALAHIELCAAQQQFFDVRGAKQSLSRAADLARICVRVGGQLGVRTKFQQKAVSQLIARVFSVADAASAATSERLPLHAVATVFPTPAADGGEDIPVPRNVPLDDSDVLGYIKFVPLDPDAPDQGEPAASDEPQTQDEDDFVDDSKSDGVMKSLQELGPEILDLTPFEQVIVLAHAALELAQNAGHILSDEQAAPYVARVLGSVESKHGTSSVTQIRALMMRTMFERERGRYMERNMSQMETVSAFVDAYLPELKDVRRELAATERNAMVFASGSPPRWSFKKELAIAFGRLGLVKSAMDIFRDLEYWDELVDCHRLIGNLGAAEELVNDLLNKLDDDVSALSSMAGADRHKKAIALRKARRPRLLCVLGDITRDTELYEKAWRESNSRYGRAKRSLGRNAVERKDWADAVVHFREALRLNPLFPDIWFTCGCSAVEAGDMETAAACFTRVVQESPSNGEAWNNLGRVLCEIGRPKEGLVALLEGAKKKRDSWRVWDNVLLVASRVKSSPDIVRALDRLLELRGKDAVVAHPIKIAVDEIIRMARNAPEGAIGSATKDNTQAVSSDERVVAGRTCRALLGVLARATTLVSSDPAIWDAYARLHEVVPGPDSRRKVVECRQKQIRCLMSNGDWKREVPSFRSMAAASFGLATAALHTGDKSLGHAAKLHVKSIITQTEDDFGDVDAFLLLIEANTALAVSE